MIVVSPVLTNFCAVVLVVTVVVSSLSTSLLFVLNPNESKTANSTGTINIKKGETEEIGRAHV